MLENYDENDERRDSSSSCCWLSCFRSNKIDSDDGLDATPTRTAAAAAVARVTATKPQSVITNGGVGGDENGTKQTKANAVVAANGEHSKSDKCITHFYY